MAQDYPSKLYYSISEVAQITGVKAHVLRYWETEFPTLKPKKTRNGSRRYRQGDIEEILAIKHLLYTEGFKIAGARKMRRQARSQVAETEAAAPAQMALGFDSMDDKGRLDYVKEQLQDLLHLIRKMTVESEKEQKTPELKAREEEA